MQTRAFAGIARKVVLPFIVLTLIGWFLVVVGFGIGSQIFVDIYMVGLDPDISIYDKNDERFSLYNNAAEHFSYPYWIVCIVGPFLAIVAVIHAATWKPLSTYVGAIVAVLSVLFLTGLGMVLVLLGEVIRDVDQDKGDFKYSDYDFSVPAWFRLQFAGALIAALFWTLGFVTMNFYDFETTSEPQQDRIARTYQRMLLAGIARKLVVPFLMLVGVGWILVLTGFCVGTNTGKDDDDDDYDDSDDDFAQTGANDRDEPISYMFWIVIISGPLTIFTSLLHAVLWKPFSHFFGAIASFLVCLFLTGLGMVMYYTGFLIDEAHISDKYNSEFYKEEKEDGDLIKIPWWFAMEFAGALIATVFMTIVLVLVHFYDVDFQWPFKSCRPGEVTYSHIANVIDPDAEPPAQPIAPEDPNRSDIM